MPFLRINLHLCHNQLNIKQDVDIITDDLPMKIHWVLILWVFFIILTPTVVTALPIVHPGLLFDDIRETPGYKYSAIQPWKGYQNQILRSANSSLRYNFSDSLGSYDRVVYRGEFARDLGLAYQITSKPEYAVKAREALLNMDRGKVLNKGDTASALGAYSLAYDWIQPALDPSTDVLIRDKLAKMADTVYKDLNDNGSTRKYVSFADYHGQAYPNVGIAGAALSDYKNPNNLPLSSTPEDWNKVGTDYLFVNDKLHSYGRSLLSFGFDEVSGKFLNGGYKSYVLLDFMWWLQVYNHTYKENPLEKYPSAKRAFTSELWESLPNGYSNNYVTLGNTKWTYHEGFLNLLDDQSKSNALNHDELLKKSSILPYSRSLGVASPEILYCVYENYDSIARSYPNSTSHLDQNAIYQVFRGNWKEDADWLSLVTWNTTTNSNRDMLHNDQLGVEYYSRGDLLLGDAGENKYVLDKLYGYYDIHHNTIAIENPRTPFPVSPWSGSASQGIYKGDSHGLISPAIVDSVNQLPWIELIKTHVTINQLMSVSFGSAEILSSPIHYERTILYPDTDYFIIIDRMEGTEPWIYRNIFRPTSLMVTATKDTNKDGKYDESEVGHVNGALTIGSVPFNWQALPYKTETNTGITTNSFTWNTKNPYGKEVRLNLYSIPSSEILIEKNVGRIGGYDAPSEVFSPIVWFRTPATTAEYRVTVLLSSYTNEEAKTAQEILVTGTGHAMKIHSSVSDDYIYTGKGNSSFGEFSTDADSAFIRQRGDAVEITVLKGSYLDYRHQRWVDLSKKANYVTVKKDNESLDYRIQAEPDLRGELFSGQIDPEKIQIVIESKNPKSDTISVSSFGSNSGETFNLVTFLKKIAKQVFSFLNIKNNIWIISSLVYQS
jgi:hypothetical protein